MLTEGGLMNKRNVILVLFFLCASSTWAADRTFTGTFRLTQDTNFLFDNITFDPGSVIVTNGHRLTIEAKRKITLKGNPQIISYEPRAMTPGESGRSGNVVIIKSPRLDGTVLKIVNTGENGAPGAAGANGPKGSKGAQGTQRDWNAFNGCIGGSNGTQGGPGGDGADGGQGGNGGSGGAIVIDIATGCMNGGAPRLDLNVGGGTGAAGGPAGAAGPGGDGGDGAPGTFWCGGTSPGPPGPSGRAGRPGPIGSTANPGALIDIRQNCTTQLIPEATALGAGKRQTALRNPQ
jgi:hypothetical protein